jgi:hypothetical protein
MEAKRSSLVSYGLSLDALQDFLLIALSLDVKTVRYDTFKVAKRLEAALGDEQASCIKGDPPSGLSYPRLKVPSQWGLTEDTCAIGLTRSIHLRSWSARVSGAVQRVQKTG